MIGGNLIGPVYFRRWAPGEPVDHARLNVPLDHGIFSLSTSGLSTSRRMGRNWVHVHTEPQTHAIVAATVGTGQYQWQTYTMVSADQAGWDDMRATAILEDE